VLLYVMNRHRTQLAASFDRLVMKRGAPAPAIAAAGASEALRDFGLGAQVLADLGLRRIRLMIHSDRKIAALEGFGIEIVDRVPLPGRAAGRRREAQ
jgi:GTP cyclohydrolase II